MGFVKSFKKAMDGIEGDTYVIQGENVKCPLCGSETFEESEAQLNTAGLTFLNLDWANKSAYVLVCTQCTNILWFKKRPEIAPA